MFSLERYFELFPPTFLFVAKLSVLCVRFFIFIYSVALEPLGDTVGFVWAPNCSVMSLLLDSCSLPGGDAVGVMSRLSF